jgi:hypothetical protein
MKTREEFKQELDLSIPTKHKIEVGYSYLYYFDSNEYDRSICLVYVVDIVNEASSRVKFLQIFEDKSGNNFFKYLLGSDQTMVVSNCYLHPIHIVNEQKKHIELLSQLLAEGVSELEKNVEEPSCSPFDPTPADRVFPVQINLIESNSGKKTFNIQVGEYDYAYDAENLKQAIEMFDRNICEIQLD